MEHIRLTKTALPLVEFLVEVEQRRRELRQDPDAIAWGGLCGEAELEIEREREDGCR